MTLKIHLPNKWSHLPFKEKFTLKPDEKQTQFLYIQPEKKPQINKETIIVEALTDQNIIAYADKDIEILSSHDFDIAFHSYPKEINQLEPSFFEFKIKNQGNQEGPISHCDFFKLLRNNRMCRGPFGTSF